MARSIMRYRDHRRSGETAGKRASWRWWAPLAAGAMIALALAGCARVAPSTSTGPGDGMLWVNYSPTAPFLSAMYP